MSHNARILGDCGVAAQELADGAQAARGAAGPSRRTSPQQLDGPAPDAGSGMLTTRPDSPETPGNRSLVVQGFRPLVRRACDDGEHVVRTVIYKLIDWTLIRGNLYGARWDWQRRLAWWALPYWGGWGRSPRACYLDDRRKARTCEHNWRYDEQESQGPWTGYIERCIKCNALQQVPQ